MRKLLFGCASVLTIALLPVSTANAQAQPAKGHNAQDVTEVGEVLVTARKRAERLRDVPVAASVVDVESLEARGGVADVQTLLSTVPGLRYFNTSTPANSEISLRSSGTSRGTSAEAAVGLYRNGAYVGGGGNLGGRNFSTMDLFDIGRLEVLRGTQGALYGRNAVGGAVNVISALPTPRFEGFADVRYSINNEKLQTQLVTNMPLSDEVAIRVGGFYTKQDGGFFYNPINDKYHDGENANGIRGQIRFERGKFDINLLAERQVAAVPSLVWQTYILPNAASGFPLGLITEKYSTNWNTSPTAKQNVGMVNLTVNYAFDFGTLTSTSMYRVRRSLSSFDGDGTNAVALAAEKARGNALLTTDSNNGTTNQNLAETLYQDLHLAGSSGERLTYLAGLELLQIKSHQDNITTRTPTTANRSIGQRTVSFAVIQSASLYGSVGYALTDALNLSAEGRYTSDKRTNDTNRFDRTTGLPAGAALIRNASTTPKHFTYNVSAGYKITSNWLAYGKVGTGFRAGGFNTGAGDPRQPVPIPDSFDDEISTTYEVGAKGNLTPNIYTTAAVYGSRIKDFLVQRDNGCLATNPVCPVGATSFLINAGKAETWGVELEATARYDLVGGVLRIDASVARQGGKVVAGPYKDLKIPQSPEWNGSASVNYRRPLFGDVSGFANLNYAFQTGGVQEIEGTPQLYDNGILDARLGIEMKGVEAAVYATNAANESYIIYTTDTMRRWNQPRVYGVQLRYRW